MNSPDPADDEPIDPRILTAARIYLRQCEAGGQPDRNALLEATPEIAEELSEYLDGIELAQALKAGRGSDRGSGEGTRDAQSLPPAYDGQPLGDFKIVREIGRGGMAVVYEAIQLSLGRRVALKVLPLAAAMDERQLQRFQLEAQAAAQLHHPCIVPVHAVGCDRGVHFYAMQLINGQPLSALIDDLKRQQTTPGRPASGEDQPTDPTIAFASAEPLTLAESTLRALRVDPTSPAQSWAQSRPQTREHCRKIAESIAQIADALDYAHQAGIVHRDVKPGNLLLDTHGRVWVADFGLAQITAGAGVTQTGDLLGTLRYMSPEQAAGRRTEIDHRTDIYSLGATMYEWLCLTPIFSGNDRQHLLHQILHADPLPPRQIDRRIPFELETILLKAVAKIPGERYATAAEFAADLRRFIDERPILARRANLIDHARKWVRRHPGAVAVSVLAMLMGLMGLSVAIAAITNEQANTAAALRREQEKSIEAEARLALAQRAADEMISIAEEELSDNPFEEHLRQRLLDSAIDYYQAFIAAQSQNPDAQAELAATQDRVRSLVADLKSLQADRESMLLTLPHVLADLRLDSNQQDALQQWLRQKEPLWPSGDGPDDANEWTPGRWQQLRIAAARESEQTLGEILSQQQRTRLRQIALQWQGARALQDPDVAERLGLTGEQKRQIREIESEFRRPPGPRPITGGSRSGRSASLSGSPSPGRPPSQRSGGGPRRPGLTGVAGQALSPQPRDGNGKPPHEGTPPGNLFGFGGFPLAPPPFQPFDLGQRWLERSLAVLRPEQRSVWEELIGDPWEVTGGPPGRGGPAGLGGPIAPFPSPAPVAPNGVPPH
ncbi:MAG: hypothetical protein EA381_03240 [Planctomycetaceae bacterium]|nr:MAG: hypothetical protein EA381_03240 [Planctomycetaceae bacterium]